MSDTADLMNSSQQSSAVLRNTAVGAVLGLLVIGGLFLASRYLDNGTGNPELRSGFVGARSFGAWQLICFKASPQPQAPANDVPLPLHLSAADSGFVPAARTVPLGRCRATISFRRRDDPGRAVDVSFRLLGTDKVLAMIVRFPPLAKRGDPIILRLGEQRYTFTVADCPGGACVALTALDAEIQKHVLSSPNGTLIFPPGVDGRRLAIAVPFAGLAEALSNMRVAESPLGALGSGRHWW